MKINVELTFNGETIYAWPDVTIDPGNTLAINLTGSGPGDWLEAAIPEAERVPAETTS